MRSNADLTIYRRGTQETYTREVVKGITWEDRRGANLRTPGEIKADDVAVYIPASLGVSLLNVGDILVKGIVTDEIGPGMTPTQLREKYPGQTAVVMTVDNHDIGSRAMWHQQVGAK